MTLIDTEDDDRELLRAEDEAIAAAARPPTETPGIPLGSDLANLIESLSNAPNVQS